MPERMRANKPAQSESSVVEGDMPAASVSGERLRDEIDDLLEEIDEVLESNAEEFVKNYVQKGGE